MADEIQAGAILEPPGAILCDCGDLIGYIEIPNLSEPLAVVHPCHCELLPSEIEALMTRNHPHLAEKFNEKRKDTP